MRPILGLMKVIFIIPPEEVLQSGSSLAALEQQSPENAEKQADHHAPCAPDPAQSFDRGEDGVVQDVEADVGVQHLPLAVLVDGGAAPPRVDLDHAPVLQGVGIGGAAAVDPEASVEELRQDVGLGLDLHVLEQRSGRVELLVDIALQLARRSDHVLVHHCYGKILVQVRHQRLELARVERLRKGLEECTQLVVVLLVFLVIGAPGCACDEQADGKHPGDQLVHHASPFIRNPVRSPPTAWQAPHATSIPPSKSSRWCWYTSTAAAQSSRNQASRRRRAQGGETTRSEPRIRALQETCSDGTRLWGRSNR